MTKELPSVATQLPKLTSDKNYREMWPTLANVSSVNLIHQALNFYALYAVSFNAYGEVGDSIKAWPSSDDSFLREIMEFDSKEREQALADRNEHWTEFQRFQYEARGIMENHLAYITPMIRDYMIMATLGEARHNQDLLEKVFPPERAHAWVSGALLYDKYGIELMKMMAEVHDQIKSGNVSGPRWASVTRVAYSYLTGAFHPDPLMNNIMFLDRTWSLQHNCGTLFDKINWTTMISGPRVEVCEYCMENGYDEDSESGDCGTGDCQWDHVAMETALNWHGDTKYIGKMVEHTTGKPQAYFEKYLKMKGLA